MPEATSTSAARASVGHFANVFISFNYAFRIRCGLTSSGGKHVSLSIHRHARGYAQNKHAIRHAAKSPETLPPSTVDFTFTHRALCSRIFSKSLLLVHSLCNLYCSGVHTHRPRLALRRAYVRQTMCPALPFQHRDRVRSLALFHFSQLAATTRARDMHANTDDYMHHKAAHTRAHTHIYCDGNGNVVAAMTLASLGIIVDCGARRTLVPQFCWAACAPSSAIVAHRTVCVRALL